MPVTSLSGFSMVTYMYPKMRLIHNLFARSILHSGCSIDILPCHSLNLEEHRQLVARMLFRRLERRSGLRSKQYSNLQLISNYLPT